MKTVYKFILVSGVVGIGGLSLQAQGEGYSAFQKLGAAVGAAMNQVKTVQANTTTCRDNHEPGKCKEALQPYLTELKNKVIEVRKATISAKVGAAQAFCESFKASCPECKVCDPQSKSAYDICSNCGENASCQSACAAQ